MLKSKINGNTTIAYLRKDTEPNIMTLELCHSTNLTGINSSQPRNRKIWWEGEGGGGGGGGRRSPKLPDNHPRPLIYDPPYWVG